MKENGSSKYPTSRFSRLDVEHLELVRTWRNKPRVRENMFTTQEISSENHRSWFEKLKDDPSRLYLVFFQDNRPIGTLNFSGLGSPIAQWGCFLGEEDVWPGSGLLLELAALDCAFNELKLPILEAEVLEFNSSAIKLHQFFDYAKTGKIEAKIIRNELPVAALVYRYTAEDWQKNRQKIIDKLPAQIKAASSQVFFHL